MKQSVKNSLLIAAAVSGVGISSLVGAGLVSAQSEKANNPLVDAISTKFHLNKDEVQKVFDDERAQHEAEHQKVVASRLQKLVDEGTITATQRAAIESKLVELRADQDSHKDESKDLTPAERKVKMQAKKAELDAWAKAQGLDLSKLRGVFMFGAPRSMGPMVPDDTK